MLSLASAKTWKANVGNTVYTSVDVGIDQLLELTFSRYNAEIETKGFFCNTTTIYRNDKIQNLAGELVKINTTTKNVNEVFDVFTEARDYVFLCLTTARTGVIHVVDLDPPHVSINVIGIGVDYNLSKSNFTLSSDYIVTLDTVLPKTESPMVHSGFVQVIIGNQTPINIPLDFVVNKYYEWNVTNMKFNNTVNAGDTGIYGKMTIENRGNSVLDLNVSCQGTLCDVITLKKNTIVYPGVPTIIDFLYNLGLSAPTGNYTGAIILKSISKETRFNMTIFIKDIKPAVITDVVLPVKFMAGLSREIKAKVTDNIGVNNVLLYVYKDGKEIKQTGFVKGALSEWWLTDVVLPTVGEHTLRIKAIDSEGNVVFKNISIDVYPDDVVMYERYINFLTTKKERWTKEHLLTINESIPLTLEIKKVDYNGNISLALLLPSGQRWIIDESQDGSWKPMTFLEDGEYFLEVKGDAYDDYSFLAALSTDVPHVPFEDISIHGDIKDFYIPEEYDGEWYGGILNMEILDGGNPESSKTVVTLEYPGYVDIKDMGVPVTGELKREKEREFNSTITKLNQDIFKKDVFIFCLVCLLVFLFVLYIIITQVIEKTYFKLG